MKPCIECKVVKPLDDYYAHPEMADGRLGVCKACHKRRMKVRRLTDDYVQEYERKRAKTPKRRTARANYSSRWRAEHPEAYKAQTAVHNAIRDGRLTKMPCSLCGTKKHVHGHHRDYSKPLDVIWLCAKCHHRLHATFPELGGHSEARP